MSFLSENQLVCLVIHAGLEAGAGSARSGELDSRLVVAHNDGCGELVAVDGVDEGFSLPLG